MTEIKGCKGCRSEVNCRKHTDIISRVDIAKCSCVTCLVKGVCNDPCENFKDFFKNYYEDSFLIHIWRIKTYDHEAIKKRMGKNKIRGLNKSGKL